MYFLLTLIKLCNSAGFLDKHN